MGPTIKLSSGYEMPQVGFGLWKVDNAVAADTVYNAIKVGYRLFDGAAEKKKANPNASKIAPHLPSATKNYPAKWATKETPARCSEELVPYGSE
ncbi:hypothetical protein ONZ43_g1204 [Nemania bipapillata]|uniref:Uncharacterized protein n=1 Tax=Nemania bipapillata TaxID=110536 RepID=A0ACC2J5H2_9PEZI|nr:hypothetical protein ONZ43_g1204 [Nemania bipapillata]